LVNPNGWGTGLKMPERQIQLTEYKCQRCHYQWISRTLNEKYKEVKRSYRFSGYAKHRDFTYPNKWTDEFYINSKPKYCPKCKSCLWDTEYMDPYEKLLRTRLVNNTSGYGTREKICGSWEPTYITRYFLYIHPTVEELERVLGQDMHLYNIKPPFDGIEHNDKDGIAKRRQELMLEILKEHGVTITPEDIEQYRQRKEEQDKDFRLCDYMSHEKANLRHKELEEAKAKVKAKEEELEQEKAKLKELDEKQSKEFRDEFDGIKKHFEERKVIQK
jgi:hypothetical protein